MSNEWDEQNRQDTAQYGSNPATGSDAGSQGSTAAHAQQPSYDQSSYQQAPYPPPSYDQSGYDQSGYGQAGYDQSGYDRSGYGQPGYDQAGGHETAPYGQDPSPYGYQQQYGQQSYAPSYGTAAVARPGGVITAAVLGFVFGALGVLVTAGLLLGGALLAGAASGAGGLGSEIPGFDAAFDGFFGAAAGIIIVVGVLALIWTVAIIWGSAWALTGRSRVLLLVAGSISLAATGFSFFGSLGTVDQNGAGGVVIGLLMFAAAVAIVVLLSLPPASQFFAAHRARRGR